MKKSVWFVFFGLLVTGPVRAETLLEIYDLAVENDYGFKAAQSALLAGKESRALATSLLLPKVDLDGSWQYSKVTREFDSSNPFAVNSELVQEVRGPSFNISLSQPLLDIAALHQYESGKLLEKISILQFESAKSSLLIRTATVYFQALTAGAKLTAAQSAEEAYRIQLQSANAKFTIGLARQSDVLEAQARYDAAVADTILAKNNLSTYFDIVKVFTGKNHNELAALPTNFEAKLPEPTDFKQWSDSANTNNLRLNVDKLTAQQAYENSRAKASEYLPKVTGNLGYSQNYDERRFSDAVPDDLLNKGVTASVRLTVPLYTGGALSASAREAKYRYLETLDQSNNSAREVAQEIHSNYLSVIANVSAVKARRAAIKSSESALDFAKKGYEQGVRSILDVLDAQNAAYQANQRYAETVYDYLIAGLKLKDTAGLLSRSDIEDLSRQLDQVTRVYSPVLN